MMDIKQGGESVWTASSGKHWLYLKSKSTSAWYGEHHAFCIKVNPNNSPWRVKAQAPVKSKARLYLYQWQNCPVFLNRVWDVTYLTMAANGDHAPVSVKPCKAWATAGAYFESMPSSVSKLQSTPSQKLGSRALMRIRALSQTRATHHPLHFQETKSHRIFTRKVGFHAFSNERNGEQCFCMIQRPEPQREQQPFAQHYQGRNYSLFFNEMLSFRHPATRKHRHEAAI